MVLIGFKVRNSKKATSRWFALLPGFLHDRINRSPDLQKIIKNTAWLIGDRILRMIVGMLVGVWVARYLGPDQYGLINYAMAFVGIFGGLASLGLNGIVVRDLVRAPEDANATLGTAFLLQLLAGSLSLALAIIAIMVFRPGDDLLLGMVVVLGFILVFKATEVIRYWFESQVQSRFIVLVENGAYMLSIVIKIIFISIRASLMAFVWTTFVEGLLIAVGFLFVYILHRGPLRTWRPYLKRARSLLNESWPLLISGTLVLVNMNLDKVMIGQLANAREVGIYSAANVFVGFWYFVPVAIIGSIAPKLIATHASNIHRYHELSKRIYKYFGIGGSMLALLFSLFSESIISFFYGYQFRNGGPVLAISIWAIVFVFQVSFRGRLLVIEGEQIYISVLILLGTVTNIFLNFLLIPTYGAIGGAIAYTASWGMSAIVFPAFFNKTRHHAVWSVGLDWIPSK